MAFVIFVMSFEFVSSLYDFAVKRMFYVIFNLRFQNATNQLDNTSRIKEVRKNIARIQTIMAEKAAE